MKTKSFWKRNKVLILFCVVFWSVFFFIVIPASAKNPRKVEKEFKQRQAECIAEQTRIQNKGIKHYNPRNKWQKGRR